MDDQGNAINGTLDVIADVSSGLPALSQTIDHSSRQALVTVPLLMIQLGLLALFVLWLVLVAAVEQRRPEAGLARLRGSGRRGARALVLGQLLPVVITGIPLGALVALGLSALARATVLGGRAPFEVRPAFWLALAGTAVLLAGLTWATTLRGTRGPISSLFRSVPSRVAGWELGVAEALAVAASGALVLAFVTGSLRGPLALAAPAMVALTVGLLLSHLVVPGATWLGRRTMARGRYASGVALLATSRRPATRRVVTVVTVASALLLLSTVAIDVGARNRQLVAERDTGAPMVAEVTGTDLGRVTRALAGVADGHATPVVRLVAPQLGGLTTLAVVPDQFRRVALLPGTDPASVPWSSLQVATGRRLRLTGREISLRARPRGFTVSGGQQALLQLEVVDARGEPQSVDLEALPTAGSRVLRARIPCLRGCTAAGLTVRSSPGVVYSGNMQLGQVRITGGSTDLPGAVADWRAGTTPQGTDRVEAVASGSGTLSLRLENTGRGSLGMTSRWFPVAVPALVGGPDRTGGGAGSIGSGLDGTQRAMTRVGSLPWAPGVGGPARVVDLGLLEHWGSRVARSGRIQVWFDSESPARLAQVRTALEGAGLTLHDVRRLSQVRRAYDTAVPAWSLQLGVLVASAGLLLAALVLALLVASTWRLRTWDLACLGMSGVPRRGLARIAIGEQLPAVLISVPVGAACGVVGARYALPTVPLFPSVQQPPGLDLSVPWATVGVMLAGALLVLGLIAAACGYAVVARAHLSRVREPL